MLNPIRELGNTGIMLPACGFGAMGMSEFYGKGDDEQSCALLKEVVESGCMFWDTADQYGVGHNERLLAPILKESREKVFICTKFSVVRGEDGSRKGVRGDWDYVHQACDASLARLGIEQIDLYYQHRVDPKTPIEETVRAMKDLQEQGKVRFLGLSECSAETLERALKVARIEAVQIEYSPWETNPERSGLLDAMRKHKISMVAYSPLGRGILTGAIKSLDDLAEDDYRRNDPRYQGEAFDLNMRLVHKIAELAVTKAQASGQPVTPASFCLAWVLYQDPGLFVIPGTKSSRRFQENISAGNVLHLFTEEDNKAVRGIVNEIQVVGKRYGPAVLQYADA